ncbi:MAG: hypothetical protein LBK24_00560 [Puniceicoccales bacterium]|jgi:hypothetical protein|nr:hypothetical protein [Puniceicoccales bacterium]
MADKIKHQSTEKESKDSFENDAFSRREIAEMKKKADSRDASLFAEKLAKSKSGQQGSDSGAPRLDSQRRGFPEFQGSKLERSKTGRRGRGFDSSKTDLPEHEFDDERAFLNPQETVQVPVDIPLASGYVNPQRRDLSPKSVDAAEVKDTSAMSGARILASMQLQHIEPKVNESAQVIKSLIQQVVEKITATYEALNAQQQVIVTLRGGIVENMRVFISKVGRVLHVVVAPGSKECEMAAQAGSGTLVRRLQNNLKDIDRVDIVIEQHGQQGADDDQGNKGRGNQQQGKEEEEKQDHKKP